MTGIPALHGAASLVPVRGRAGSGQGGFALSGAAMAARDPGAAAGAGAAAAAGALAGLLALQEDASDRLRDRNARRHGRAMLAALAAWQRALLADAGRAPEAAAALERLGALLAAMPPAADPALAGALGAVALRCRIELARWE